MVAFFKSLESLNKNIAEVQKPLSVTRRTKRSTKYEEYWDAPNSKCMTMTVNPFLILITVKLENYELKFVNVDCTVYYSEIHCTVHIENPKSIQKCSVLAPCMAMASMLLAWHGI